MNGVHDMGGMHDMGRVLHEANEPVFHEPWEGRVYALNRAAAAGEKWALDAARYEIEVIPPVEYLRMSYHERWHTRLVELLVKRHMVTRAEIASGQPAPGSPKTTPLMKPQNIAAVMAPANPQRPQADVVPRFTVGDRVQALNIHPTHHTRLPRYLRGREGVIVRHHGTFVFSDTNAHEEGENPLHVYSVQFSARELWGSDDSSRDSVHLDLWDAYLEHV